MYVGFVGHLFLSLLKSIIVPLIVPSIITAIGTITIHFYSINVLITDDACEMLRIQK